MIKCNLLNRLSRLFQVFTKTSVGDGVNLDPKGIRSGAYFSVNEQRGGNIYLYSAKDALFVSSR